MATRTTATQAQQIEYYTGKGHTLRTFKKAPVRVLFFKEEKSGKYVARAWVGKRDKAAWYYLFSDYAKLCAYVNAFVREQAAALAIRDAQKAAKKAEKAAVKASEFFSVGDVIVNSWGYDQTNVDFYEVVEVLAKSVRLRRVASNTAERENLTALNQPRRGDYIGRPFLKTLNQWGAISFKHGGARKWTGKAVSSSATH